MPPPDPAQSATTDGLTISPALDLLTESEQIPQQHVLVDLRVLRLCGISVLIGVVASFAAKLQIGLIALITNIALFARFSLAGAVPADAVQALVLAHEKRPALQPGVKCSVSSRQLGLEHRRRLARRLWRWVLDLDQLAIGNLLRQRG
jgi:hypothetical protein